MSTGTLNGVTCTKLRAHIPAWGIWFASVTLDQEESFAKGSAAQLELAGLSLVGSVVSGGPWKGGASYRVIGGKGGWAATVAAKDYANDAGVKLSTVIGDLATETGETCEGIPGGTVGAKWTRAEDVASFVLHQLAPRAWYMGEDGITRFGKRAASTVDGSVTRGVVDLAAGFVELMPESLVGLVPGATAEGVEAVDVEHELDGAKLRTRLWGAVGHTSKRLAAWAALFDQLDPLRRYRGRYEYRVVSQEIERLNLQPVRVSLGMPVLRRVRVSPGLPGCRATHALGARVHVAFLNNDPASPRVVSFDDAEAPSFMPLELDLGESPRLGVARVTDTVVAGPWGGTITGGSSRVKAGL